MKNKIIIITLIISVILVMGLAIFGIKIGNFEIPSISKIIAKNNQINSNIEEATRLTSLEYPQKISDLETTINNFNVQKEKYEQLSGFSNEENKGLYETEKYDIGYLWTTLGNYANKNKIKLAIDVKKASATNLYDLYFTVQGEYVDISSFVTKIENDSELSFRIYNFKITPGNSNVNLKATFVVKDVNIDDSTLIKQSSSLANTKGLISKQSDNSTSENTSENSTQNTVQ